jgi:hypothetical protein
VKVFIASALVVVMVVLSILGSYALALRALGRSQDQMCTVLELLTRHPVPRPADPKANPSREQDYVFYVTFRQVENNYRCR